MNLTAIINRLNELTTFMNNVISNSKKIWQLPDATIGTKLVAIWNLSSETTEKYNLTELIEYVNSINTRIVAYGTIDRDENEFTFNIGFEWVIQGIDYANADAIVHDIELADTGENRIDIAVLNATNGIDIVTGFETSGTAEQPLPPLNTILLKIFVVTDSTIDEQDPVTDDYQKIYLAEERITEEVLTYTLPTDGRTNFIFMVGGFEMEGFVIPSGHEHLFAGKLFFLYNLSDDPITLLHQFGSAPILFTFEDELDFVLAPKAKAMFQYSPVYGLQLVSGGSSDPTIEKLFTVSLAQIGASDIEDVDDIRTKLQAYAASEGLVLPIGELHRWEVVESFPITDNFSLKSSNWGSVVDSGTFQTFLEGLGLTGVVISNFSLVSDLLSCNLTFTGTTLDFSSINLTELINIDALAQLTTLNLYGNSISVLCSFDAMVNLTLLQMGDNDITTAEWNKMSTWVPLSAATGTISTSPNTDGFSTSTTYTLLSAKGGWSIS